MCDLVPPDVYTRSETSVHSIGDTVILHCLIDANPEPDIRWFHRFSDEINQEMDLSRQFSQENFDDRGNKIWYIQNEQLNNTRWKTSLFIKHIPRRLFNSNFICRAKNRHGTNEQSINIIERTFSSRKYHYYTTSSTSYSPVPVQQITTSTLEFLPSQTDEIPNRSKRVFSYLYLFELYSLILTLYI